MEPSLDQFGPWLWECDPCSATATVFKPDELGRRDAELPRLVRHNGNNAASAITMQAAVATSAPAKKAAPAAAAQAPAPAAPQATPAVTVQMTSVPASVAADERATYLQILKCNGGTPPPPSPPSRPWRLRKRTAESLWPVSECSSPQGVVGLRREANSRQGAGHQAVDGKRR